MMDWTLLIINLLAGAFVGYVTKTLAINMLFRRYPIIGGAKIIDDREQLEIAMSQLVEERLIKPDTLLREFQKPAFKASFETLIDSIVQETLHANLRELDAVKHIDGIEKTLENLKDFLISQEQNYLPPTVKILLKHIAVSDLLSSEQIQYVVKNILLLVSALIYQHRQSLGQIILDEARMQNWHELLPDSLISHALEQIFPDDLGQRLSPEDQAQIKAFVAQALELCLPESLLLELETSLKQRSVADLLGQWAQADALQSLFERLQSLLLSASGRHLLERLLDLLVALLKDLDIPLAKLLTEEIEQSLWRFVEGHLPELILQLEAWVSINRSEMEGLINQSIEEHLASEGLIKLLVGNIFVQKLAERYQIVETALQELKTLAHENRSQLVPLIRRLLNNTRVSDVVKLAEDYVLDRPALIEVLLGLIQVYFPRLHLAAADQLLQIKLSDLPGIGELKLIPLLKKHIFPAVAPTLIEQFLQNPAALSSFREQLLAFLQGLRQQLNQSEILEPCLQSIKSLSMAWINQDSVQNALIDSVSQELRRILGQQNLIELLDDDLQAELHLQLGKIYRQKLDQFVDELKHEKILNLYHFSAGIYQELCQNSKFPQRLADTLVGLMVKLIGENRLLDGKIYIAVKESFSRFSNPELQDEMESFMGEELQPIKLLGAFLGAGVGVIMWWLAMIPGYSAYVTGYWALLSYSIAYALSEVGTNWMAIKMLFRPYYPRRFLGMKLPFTPGIFPKNKSALAESMVNFVDKKLLAKDNMVRILEKYHPQWKAVIKRVIAQNDYALIDQTIQTYSHENYEHLAPELLRLGFAQVQDNRQEIASSLLNELQQFQLDQADLDRLQSRIEKDIIKSQDPLIHWLQQAYQQLQTDTRPLGQSISASSQSLVGQGLQSAVQWALSVFTQTLKAGQLPLAVQNRLATLLQSLISQHLRQLLPLNVLEQIQQALAQWFSQQLQHPDWHLRVLDWLENQILNRGISADLTLGELWDGRLIQAAINESDVIIQALSEYLLKLSQKQKTAIVRMILSEVEKKGLVESVMVAFGGIERDVSGVVDVLLDDKLPDYLGHKQQELCDVFQIYVEQKLAPVKLIDLGLHQQIFDIVTVRQVLQVSILQNPQFQLITQDLAANVLGVVFEQLALQDLLSMLDLDSLDQMQARFASELDSLRQSSINLLTNESAAIEKLTAEIAHWAFSKLIYQQSSQRLLAGFTANEFESWSQTCIKQFYQSQLMQQARPMLVQALLNVVQADPVRLSNERVLLQDLANLLGSLSDPIESSNLSRDFQVDVQIVLRPMLMQVIELLNDQIEMDTKHVLEDILVNSLVDSLRMNNREIMEPIAFDQIVREEVQAMEPARIEAMFDFAKPIFRLLIWYGALGGIIGLAVAFFELMR